MPTPDFPAEVSANINYFSRSSVFDHEKPYVTSFPVDGIEGASITNHEFDTRLMTIQNTRGNFAPRLNTHGFTYLDAPTSMSLADFDHRSVVQEKYFSELRALLHSKFPEYTAFVFFDYEVRKRSNLYPTEKGAVVEWAQPLAQAHVDYTVDGALNRLERVLRGRERELLIRPCDLLNVWRPLQGPNDDWPLALCDFTSIDSNEDIISNDVVYENSVGEDAFLRFNENHKWYYLGGQTPQEVVLWRNTNLPSGDKPRAFHTAFDNPFSTADVMNMRQSIEVRVASFL